MKLPKKTTFKAATPKPKPLGQKTPSAKGNSYGKPETLPSGKRGKVGKLKSVQMLP